LVSIVWIFFSVFRLRWFRCVDHDRTQEQVACRYVAGGILDDTRTGSSAARQRNIRGPDHRIECAASQFGRLKRLLRIAVE